MSLLLLFRGSGTIVHVIPAFSDQAEGQRSFLHFPTTTTLDIDPSTLFQVNIGDEAEILYMFEEIRRRQLALVLMDGEDVLWLPRIWKGTRCAYWKSEEENCEQPLDSISPCYNTSWIGGYHYPMAIKIVYPPTNRTAISYEAGVRKEFKPRPWTINEPLLRPKDVLIEKYSGTRYEISATNDVTFRGLAMHQELTLREFPRGAENYIYQVPVPML